MTRHVNQHWPAILPSDMRYTMQHGGAHIISTVHMHPQEAHPHVEAAHQQMRAELYQQHAHPAPQLHHGWPHWSNPFAAH
eukprot:CAMPEP_0173414506 /NCGR_PEP_ID=MMETSP1356-20130122/84363_1 /TAXON_ID=77927 ORGANISM="Hemiselmis virescens, Strain PCC157" /NCGR_SAMPLE_ID=MMETSP1356 /ASSEMBLY_ACC=CAM_ASM_000847 /LENGTH=79 /DNA_ID=CAMNT_0014376693 /DNA_START=92 /DNA_END=331 /DNA_ORIENTATION=+